MGLNNGVLFVCTHNSARSQMAEGWLRHMAGDRFEVASAGVEPGTLNPLAVEAMGEVGIDISRHQAKGIREYLGHWPVYSLIVVCDKAADRCPRIWPGSRERLHWFFDDPAGVAGTHEERWKHSAACATRFARRLNNDWRPNQPIQRPRARGRDPVLVSKTRCALASWLGADGQPPGGQAISVSRKQ